MHGTRAVVTGGGGFIGGHLVGRLLGAGLAVRAVDIKPLDRWQQVHAGAENLVADLRTPEHCRDACRNADEVYHLAADMGGMGFIETQRTACMLNVLIDTHMLLAARDHEVGRFFYASSACVYNASKQSSEDVTPLKEEDAYPAMPEDGYGWQKLFSERFCRNLSEDFGLETRVARFHNVYGPLGTWDGGREKAPAAICRKVAAAKDTGDLRIDIWGTGTQTRSFMFIDDCLEGIERFMRGPCSEPMNLGSSELVTIDGLVSIVEEIAGVRLERTYDLDAPTGVNGRNSDNTKVREQFGWEPSVSLREGMAGTYAWIRDEYLKAKGARTSGARR